MNLNLQPLSMLSLEKLHIHVLQRTKTKKHTQIEFQYSETAEKYDLGKILYFFKKILACNGHIPGKIWDQKALCF